MPPDFDEVQLTEPQTEELIYQERLRIYFEVKADIAKNITFNEKIDSKKLMTAAELSEKILALHPEFILDEYSKPIFDLLCLYFSRDKKFEEYGEGFSLYKGLALAGNPGRGKTKLMEMFQLNKRQCYLLIDMNKVQEDCAANLEETKKFDFYKTFTSQVPGWGGTKRYFYQDYVTWGIDDIGKEELLLSYGNKSFVFSKIIEFRSANKHLLQYYPLHITTMLTAEQIGKKYGDFVRSRMREQFNWIDLKGEDRRK